MNKEDISTVREICQAAEANEMLWGAIAGHIDSELLGMALRGFLLTPDVARKWFGKPDRENSTVCDVIHPEGQKCSWEYTWKDHLQQLCLLSDLHQILEYYREHKV